MRCSRSAVVFESEIVVEKDVRDDCFLDVGSIESSRTVRSEDGVSIDS